MLYPISAPKPGTTENLIGFIAPGGQMVVTPSYTGGSYVFEGKASVIDDSGNAGFIDDVGGLVIPCRFKGLGRFKNGLCSLNGGFIDHSGKWFIEPRFMVAGDFSEGRAVASLNGETFGFADLHGSIVIETDFEQCRAFSGGLAAVRRDDRWGYIAHSGEIRIPHVLESVGPPGFRFEIAGVQIDGRWGFIDRSGNFVVKPLYDEVRAFSEGLAAVRQAGKWGMINPDGDLKVDFRYDELGSLEGGIAFAKSDGKAGFVSEDGSWLIQPEFDRCYRFFGELAVVRKGEVYSYIGRDGVAVWTSEPGGIVQAPPIAV